MKPKPSIKFTINIPIPQVLSDLLDKIEYNIRKTIFKISPYKCDCCGVKMYVRNPEYEYEHHNATGHIGSRVLVGNFLRKDIICRTCIVKELETKEWTPRFTHTHLSGKRSSRGAYRYWSTKHCDITRMKVRSYKDVEIYPYIDMTFCTIAWNHSYISKQVVIDTVKYGHVKTGRFGVWNKQRMAPMNEKGLFINSNGELL